MKARDVRKRSTFRNKNSKKVASTIRWRVRSSTRSGEALARWQKRPVVAKVAVKRTRRKKADAT